MAAFSGASGITTSMKSPARMPGSPITRMMRSSRRDIDPERIADQRKPGGVAEVVGGVDVGRHVHLDDAARATLVRA